MLQISRTSEYAIRGLIYLAMQQKYKFILLDEIAGQQDIPKTFLAKILMSFSKSGIIESRRGAKGGFRLARTPGQISVLDIIQSVEGPMKINECLRANGRCKREKTCPVREVWEETQEEIFKILARTTVEHLAGKALKLQNNLALELL